MVEQGGHSPLLSASYKHLFRLIDDQTPIVLKSVCEALRLCLPAMVYSTMYDLGKCTPSLWHIVVNAKLKHILE